MKFLTVAPGLSVNVKKIVSIERIDETTSRIITINGEHESILPFETILQILGQVEEESNVDIQEMAKALNTLKINSQRFEG